jgi:hypothetical protein
MRPAGVHGSLPGWDPTDGTGPPVRILITATRRALDPETDDTRLFLPFPQPHSFYIMAIALPRPPHAFPSCIFTSILSALLTLRNRHSPCHWISLERIVARSFHQTVLPSRARHLATQTCHGYAPYLNILCDHDRATLMTVDAYHSFS